MRPQKGQHKKSAELRFFFLYIFVEIKEMAEIALCLSEKQYTQVLEEKVYIFLMLF